MKIHVRTLAIEPCGCGYEGSIRFGLPEGGSTIQCSYISMADEEVAGSYEIGAEVEAPIYLAFGAISRTSKRVASLSPSVVGRFAGWEISGDQPYAMVEGLVRIPVDHELGEPPAGLEIGEWVECTGELTLRSDLEPPTKREPPPLIVIGAWAAPATVQKRVVRSS